MTDKEYSPSMSIIQSIYPGIDYEKIGYLYSDWGCGGCCNETMVPLTKDVLEKHIKDLESSLTFAKELRERLFDEPKEGDLWCVDCDMFLFKTKPGEEVTEEMKKLMDKNHHNHLLSLRFSDVRDTNTNIRILLEKC